MISLEACSTDSADDQKNPNENKEVSEEAESNQEKTDENGKQKEKEKLFRMDDPPLSRPWIQDFTASYLGAGNYKDYGKNEVEAQIKALNESGIDEFLLWNASNQYTENVDYTPPLDENVLEDMKKHDDDLRQKIEEENTDKEDDNNEEENQEEKNKESEKDQE